MQYLHSTQTAYGGGHTDDPGRAPAHTAHAWAPAPAPASRRAASPSAPPAPCAARAGGRPASCRCQCAPGPRCPSPPAPLGCTPPVAEMGNSHCLPALLPLFAASNTDNKPVRKLGSTKHLHVRYKFSQSAKVDSSNSQQAARSTETQLRHLQYGLNKLEQLPT